MERDHEIERHLSRVKAEANGGGGDNNRKNGEPGPCQRTQNEMQWEHEQLSDF